MTSCPFPLWISSQSHTLGTSPASGGVLTSPSKSLPVGHLHLITFQIPEPWCGKVQVAYLHLRFPKKEFHCSHHGFPLASERCPLFPERLYIDRCLSPKAHKRSRHSKIFFLSSANIPCVLLWIIHYGNYATSKTKPSLLKEVYPQKF